MLQACEQSAGRWGHTGGLQGEMDREPDGAYRQETEGSLGRGLEGGKEEGIEMPMSQSRGDEGAAGLDGTFYPQARQH